MKLHAFVAMPFGTKPDPDGKPIDFNRIYDELLRPALERVGLDVIRADEEQRAGDIRVDMFQELLMADLVLVDLTLDNPNVWYELGVRHALRARGVVLTLGPRGTKPFDIYTDRKLGYRLKDGAPDPDHLAADIAALAEITRETLEAGPEPDFIAESVLPATNGDAWRKRFLKLREHPLCQPPRTMPDELGPLPCDSHGNELNPYERCNLWLLNSALACGIKRTRFVCLWNGGGGDGPGGTQHLVEEVKRRTGQVTWLDTRTMW